MFAFLSAVISAEKLDIDALHNQFGKALRPEFQVRAIDEKGNRRLAVLTTFTVTQGRFELFNPFGDSVAGRCYRLAVVDGDGKVVRDIVPTTTAPSESVGHDLWFEVLRNGQVGRCHELMPDVWKGIAPGRYSLVLIANRRLIHGSPQSFKASRSSLSWEGSWKTPSQDTPLCGSLPVAIEIDKQGNCQLPDLLPLETVDLAATVSEKRELSLSVKIINPTDSWLMIRGMNTYSSMERSLSETVTKHDGSVALRHFLGSGSSNGAGPIKETEAVFVPKDGIVGGVLPHAGFLESGQYHVSVQVHESIYRDKMFVNGKKVTLEPAEWPIVFQSSIRELKVDE